MMSILYKNVRLALFVKTSNGSEFIKLFAQIFWETTVQ